MLFIGITLVEQTSWWLLTHVFGNFNITFDVDSSPSYTAPLLNVSLVLLGILYFRVRRLGRTTLSLLWGFAFVYEAVATVDYLVLDVADIEQSSVVSASWWSLGTFLASNAILVWFARQASTTSFNHALVLIGLATVFNGLGLLMPNLVFARFVGGPVAWDLVVITLLVTLFAVWVLSRLDMAGGPQETDFKHRGGSLNVAVFSDAIDRFTSQVLPRFDPACGSYRETILTLFGMSGLLPVYITLRIWAGHDLEVTEFVPPVLGIMIWILSLVLVILIAYAVRVRQPPERA